MNNQPIAFEFVHVSWLENVDKSLNHADCESRQLARYAIWYGRFTITLLHSQNDWIQPYQTSLYGAALIKLQL